MSSKQNTNLAKLVQSLANAKVINLDVTLRATVDAITAGSMDLEDPIDGFCGTIRRPWIVVRPPIVDVEDLLTLVQAGADTSGQVGAAQA
jgi:hypothetical protein